MLIIDDVLIFKVNGRLCYQTLLQAVLLRWGKSVWEGSSFAKGSSRVRPSYCTGGVPPSSSGIRCSSTPSPRGRLVESVVCVRACVIASLSPLTASSDHQLSSAKSRAGQPRFTFTPQRRRRSPSPVGAHAAAGGAADPGPANPARLSVRSRSDGRGIASARWREKLVGR